MAESQKKILIVEDSADSRDLVVLCLKRAGYDISIAGDGHEALEKAAAVHPDLILMDISMPGMDGLEATVRLKSDPLTRDIPVVVTTAHAYKTMIDRATQVGATEVLVKPLDFLALGEKLGRLIRAQENTLSAAKPPQSNSREL